MVCYSILLVIESISLEQVERAKKKKMYRRHHWITHVLDLDFASSNKTSGKIYCDYIHAMNEQRLWRRREEAEDEKEE